MNQLSREPIDRVAIEGAGRQAAPKQRRFAAAGAEPRAAPVRPLACRWRRDPVTGALICAWAVYRGAREPAAPVP